jgi:hypothetical protein
MDIVNYFKGALSFIIGMSTYIIAHMFNKKSLEKVAEVRTPESQMEIGKKEIMGSMTNLGIYHLLMGIILYIYKKPEKKEISVYLLIRTVCNIIGSYCFIEGIKKIDFTYNFILCCIIPCTSMIVLKIADKSDINWKTLGFSSILLTTFFVYTKDIRAVYILILGLVAFGIGDALIQISGENAHDQAVYMSFLTFLASLPFFYSERSLFAYSKCTLYIIPASILFAIGFEFFTKAMANYDFSELVPFRFYNIILTTGIECYRKGCRSYFQTPAILPIFIITVVYIAIEILIKLYKEKECCKA